MQKQHLRKDGLWMFMVYGHPCHVMAKQINSRCVSWTVPPPLFKRTGDSSPVLTKTGDAPAPCTPPGTTRTTALEESALFSLLAAAGKTLSWEWWIYHRDMTGFDPWRCRNNSPLGFFGEEAFFSRFGRSAGDLLSLTWNGCFFSALSWGSPMVNFQRYPTLPKKVLEERICWKLPSDPQETLISGVPKPMGAGIFCCLQTTGRRVGSSEVPTTSLRNFYARKPRSFTHMLWQKE